MYLRNNLTGRLNPLQAVASSLSEATMIKVINSFKISAKTET